MERRCWQESFDWARQWYALAFVDYLDPKVPHAKELLGVRLVLWKDAEGHWRCFEDKCPHRLAPLSGLDLVHSAFESGRAFGSTQCHAGLCLCFTIARSTFDFLTCRGPHRAI